MVSREIGQDMWVPEGTQGVLDAENGMLGDINKGSGGGKDGLATPGGKGDWGEFSDLDEAD